MRVRELFHPKVLVILTNEEHRFLSKHKTPVINLKELDLRDQRIAESLIFKDVLCKISDDQVVLNGNDRSQFTRNS